MLRPVKVAIYNNDFHSFFIFIFTHKQYGRAFGEEKFSLGNTAPPYSSMAARIRASRSGNAYGVEGLAVASSSLSLSWLSVLSSSNVLFSGLR